MRFRMIGAVVIAALAVAAAGCSSSAPKRGNSPSYAASSAASSGPGATVLGTVDTNESGCDSTVKSGDCWLPLYSGLELQGTVLNATTKPTSAHCQVKGDESGCWPQPGDKVAVLCTAIGADGMTYYGMDVPRAKQLTTDPQETKRDKLGGVIGYNSTRWVKLPAFAAAPVSCGSL